MENMQLLLLGVREIHRRLEFGFQLTRLRGGGTSAGAAPARAIGRAEGSDARGGGGGSGLVVAPEGEDCW